MHRLRLAPLFFAVIIFLITANAATTPADTPERLSTLADQRGVSLTIYNAQLALVRDLRRITLSAGINHVALRDVSAQMNAASALLRSTTDADGLSVLEQNFNYDLLSPQKLLEKYVGRSITVIHRDQKTGEERSEAARLLSLNDGIVLAYANRIETSVDGRIVFPEIPHTLRDRPTLVVDLEDRSAKTDTVELSYLTSGLSWSADYVGQLDPSDKLLDLSGLVTLVNQSGTEYRNARLQLVAGDVHQAPPAPAAMSAVATGQLRTIGNVTARSESLFEYHLYTMPHPTTIEDKQTKQIALLSAHAIPVMKTYELRGGGYYSYARSDLGSRLPVGVYVRFVNEGGELGIALPRGTVRIYKRDSSGTAQFIGEDRIEHTPRKEHVRLYLGDAFDITARRTQTDFAQSLAASYAEWTSAYELEIKNAKLEPVTVSVVESIGGTWEILSEDHPHEKTSSGTATWRISVPASSSALLHYRVRVH